MGESSKVLFVINGFGLGNATRCSSIIFWLKTKNYLVDIASSSNGYIYFKDHPFVENVFEISPLEYKKDKQNRISIIKTLFGLFEICRVFCSNRSKIKNLLKKKTYDLIVTDSDYTLFGHGGRKTPKIVSINNSSCVLSAHKEEGGAPGEVKAQLAIERLDYIFHRLFPSYLIVPSLVVHEKKEKGNVAIIPPLVRPTLKKREARPKIENILIMMSGSSFKTDLSFIPRLQKKIPGIHIDVIGQDGKSTDNCHFHGKSLENESIINKADIMIINGGASSIGEALVLNRPPVIIPIPRHAEQYLNALQVEQRKLGLMADESNICEKVCYIYQHFEKFIDAHQSADIPSNGPQIAADIIENIVRDEGREY